MPRVRLRYIERRAGLEKADDALLTNPEWRLLAVWGLTGCILCAWKIEFGQFLILTKPRTPEGQTLADRLSDLDDSSKIFRVYRLECC
jgi:hypothetical protein